MRLAAAPADGNGFRILIVKNDPSVVQPLSTQLQSAGFNVGVAINGEQGWHTFQHYDPHLVLLDVMTPGFSGWDLASRIREQSVVPMLIVTAANSIEDQIRALKIGADDFIPKPLHIQVLVARVVANLRRVYKYDLVSRAERQPAPAPVTGMPQGLPQGWSQCDDCGYMGPPHKFQAEDSNGNRIFVCPNCKCRTMTFSLG